MGIGRRSCNSTALGALHKSLLNEVGFQDILNRVFCFANCGGQIIKPNRTAIKLFNNGLLEFSIHQIESLAINLKQGEGLISDRSSDIPIVFDLCVISHPSQQTIRNPWCST